MSIVETKVMVEQAACLVQCDRCGTSTDPDDDYHAPAGWARVHGPTEPMRTTTKHLCPPCWQSFGAWLKPSPTS